jgi:hypothetical protein
MNSNRRWRDLSGRAKTATVTLGVCEAVLTATAARDLFHRPAEEVRGPKALWWPALVIQPVGPLAYLTAGRRHPQGPVRLARRTLERLMDATVTAGPCDSEDLVTPDPIHPDPSSPARVRPTALRGSRRRS